MPSLADALHELVDVVAGVQTHLQPESAAVLHEAVDTETTSPGPDPAPAADAGPVPPEPGPADDSEPAPAGPVGDAAPVGP